MDPNENNFERKGYGLSSYKGGGVREMGNEDRLLGEFFERQKKEPRGPLTDEEVHLFVENKLEGSRLESVLMRLAQNPEDQELVVSFRRRLNEMTAQPPEDGLSETLITKTLRSSGVAGESSSAQCPHCHKKISGFKTPPARQKKWIFLWVVLCAAGFGLSFLFPRYFLQCLLVSVLAGMKWIIDARALKTQILVYRALEESFGAPSRGNLQQDDARL